MIRAAWMVVLAAAVAGLTGTACRAEGVGQWKALPAGEYVLTVTMEAGPGGDGKNIREWTLPIELTIAGRVITVKMKSFTGEDLTFAGMMDKEYIGFGLAADEFGKETITKFEGKVTSTSEAAGTFNVAADGKKTNGKWTMKMKEAKEEKKDGK